MQEQANVQKQVYIYKTVYLSAGEGEKFKVGDKMPNQTPNKIELRVSLDMLDAKSLLGVIIGLMNSSESLITPEYRTIEKIYDSISLAVREHQNKEKLWRIKIRNAVGAKRGELTVNRSEVKEMVERMAEKSPNFNYVCFPES